MKPDFKYNKGIDLSLNNQYSTHIAEDDFFLFMSWLNTFIKKDAKYPHQPCFQI